MYKRLGGFVARHWVLVILAWCGVAAAAHWAAPRWDDVTRDGDLAYLPKAMASVQGEQLFSQAFPDHRSHSQIAIICERADGRLTSDDLRTLDRLAEQFDSELHPELPLVAVWTPWTEGVGKKLKSRDHQAALVVLRLTTEFMAVENIKVLQAVESLLAAARSAADFPEGLRLGVSGSAAIGGDMLASAQESIRNTEWATILLVLGILLLVYRAPVMVLIPLLTILVSVEVSLDLVAKLTQVKQVPGFEWVDFQIFKTTKIFVVVILFGAGTDFCLFLISRYKEELEKGLARAEALAAALGSVGEALVGSALTTILGLGTMYFASFGKYRNSGPAIALCLAVALAASLTLAPALLRALGRAVFWPRSNALPLRAGASPSARPSASRPSFWSLASRAILARPGWILVTSVLLLSPLAWRGLSVDISYDLLAELRAERPSVEGTQLLRQHFVLGDIGPITVLAHRRGARFDTPAGERDVAALTRLLADMPGVSSVRSIVDPLGDNPRNPKSGWRQRLLLKKHPQTKHMFLAQTPELAGEVTRLDVISKYEPFSREAVALLDRLDSLLVKLRDDADSPWHGSDFVYAGTTAGVRDLAAVTRSDQALIQKLVVIAVLGVLIAILRKPLICVYLIVSVLFSYLVTIGATALIFSRLYQPFDGLDWKVPLFLFVILTAIGEDYNIYLVTRVLEEQRRRGRMEGLRLAVERTGGIITSCGVIMAGTFLSMMFGTLRGMLELGFALSLGVMLDTIVVRPILVPAFLALLYGYARHAPSAAEPIAAPHPPLLEKPHSVPGKA